MAMANVHPISDSKPRSNSAPAERPTDDPDVDGLRRENRQLRELVVQLSTLVIKDVLNRK
jgi:hypothetical protein